MSSGADRHSNGHNHGTSHHGARQPTPFDPARAALLDDSSRFEYLPIERILALLDAPQNGLVIDFGAGTGAFAIAIAKRRPDLRIVALDQQPKMLEMLRAKPEFAGIKNIETVLTDQIAQFPGQADRILVVNVLHELDDDAMRELRSLLKPSGAAVIVDWDSAIDRSVGPPKHHTYDAVEAVKRLAQFGLEAERMPSLKYHFVLRARPGAAH